MARTSKKKTPKPAKAKKEKKVKRGRGLGSKQPSRPPPPAAIVPLDDSYRVNKQDVHKWARRGALAAASIGSAYLAHKYSAHLFHAGKTASAAVKAAGPGLRDAYKGVRGAMAEMVQAGKKAWNTNRPGNMGVEPMEDIDFDQMAI